MAAEPARRWSALGLLRRRQVRELEQELELELKLELKLKLELARRRELGLLRRPSGQRLRWSGAKEPCYTQPSRDQRKQAETKNA